MNRVLTYCALALVLLIAGRFAPAQESELANTCSDKPVGSECWMELENKPECYVWNDYLEKNEAATWIGTCSGGFAQGSGRLTLVEGHERKYEVLGLGSMADGKQIGIWTLHIDRGTVATGPFENGKANGMWMFRHESGEKEEGPVVEGEKHGRWIWHDSEVVVEGSYANGVEHGVWVTRYPNGDVREETYDNGRTVSERIRLADGSEYEVEPFKVYPLPPLEE